MYMPGSPRSCYISPAHLGIGVRGPILAQKQAPGALPFDAACFCEFLVCRFIMGFGLFLASLTHTTGCVKFYIASLRRWAPLLGLTLILTQLECYKGGTRMQRIPLEAQVSARAKRPDPTFA